MIARRSLLAGILAASAAPAIARADSLMRVVPVRALDPFWAGVAPLRFAMRGPNGGFVATVHPDWQADLARELPDGPRLRRYVATPPDASQIIRGEIGPVDDRVRFIETPLTDADIAKMRRDMDLEYREMLERMPSSRSDFLGKFQLQPRDVGAEIRKISADSGGRKRCRW
jgi:hypothetical protein